MELTWLDLAIFVGFVVAVVAVGVGMSRHEKDSEGYFLAGRGLTWWLIGFSLIAANISSEQFVGQSGSAADYVGLAIASYEWMAAITLVFVAFFFLPKFLKSGVYTIPEFLEHRYNASARTFMSLLMMVTLVAVNIPAVIYSGALTVEVLFEGQSWLGVKIDLVSASWIIGVLAALYVVAGGLKACAWADLLQGSALIAGGAVVLVLAMRALGAASPADIGLAPEMAGAGGWERFHALNAHKLHMVLPRTDLNVPWTALVVGLWIPNLYYWGLNQYIMQRTLGAQSLAEGQKGIIFAAGLKLLIPFIVIMPGMMAFNLFRGDMQQIAQNKNSAVLQSFEAARANPQAAQQAFAFDAKFAELYPDQAAQIVQFNAAASGVAAPESGSPAEKNDWILAAVAAASKTDKGPAISVQPKLVGYHYDSAFGLLVKKLGRPGLWGFIIAALFGAVTSTLAAMLNAASTIFTMDLYKRYLHKTASQGVMVFVGRLAVAVCVILGCVIAPQLGDPRFGGIFKYIQEFQGYISPGILGVFLFGMLNRRAPGACAILGLVLSPILYGTLAYTVPSLAFLDRMAVTFCVLLAAMTVLALVRPLPQPMELPTRTTIRLESSRGAMIGGALVVLVTLSLYVVFW